MEPLKQIVSNVVPLRERRHKDTIRALEQLLDQAREGHIKGLLWVAKYDDRRHDPGASGDYLKDLTSGVCAAVSLVDAIHLHTGRGG
jgi:hypothetical protein